MPHAVIHELDDINSFALPLGLDLVRRHQEHSNTNSVLLPFGHHCDWCIRGQSLAQPATLGNETRRHNVRAREDVLDCAFVHLHMVLHQGRVPVEHSQHWQDRHVSDVEEAQLALDLIQ